MAIQVGIDDSIFDLALDPDRLNYLSRQLVTFNSSLSRDSNDNTYEPINPTANASLRFVVQVSFEASVSRWYVTVYDKLNTYNTVGITNENIPGRVGTTYYTYVAYVPGQADIPPDVTQIWTIVGRNQYVSALHLSFP